jgi:kynureninase
MCIDLIQYAFTSQALAHGLDPKKTILELSPREGEFTLREKDILKTINEQGSSIALVLFSGVQYYTGQLFPMESITKKAKEQASSVITMFHRCDYLFPFDCWRLAPRSQSSPSRGEHKY